MYKILVKSKYIITKMPAQLVSMPGGWGQQGAHYHGYREDAGQPQHHRGGQSVDIRGRRRHHDHGRSFNLGRPKISKKIVEGKGIVELIPRKNWF